MEGMHGWGPPSHGSWMVPLAGVILVLVCVGLVTRWAGRWRACQVRVGRGMCWWGEPRSTAPRWRETQGQTLARRYANGEITAERFERMWRDLGASHRPEE